MKLASKLWKLTKAVNDVETLASGKPSRIAKRGVNKFTGRVLGKAGIWRRLWR